MRWCSTVYVPASAATAPPHETTESRRFPDAAYVEAAVRVLVNGENEVVSHACFLIFASLTG